MEFQCSTICVMNGTFVRIIIGFGSIIIIILKILGYFCQNNFTCGVPI